MLSLDITGYSKKNGSFLIFLRWLRRFSTKGAEIS